MTDTEMAKMWKGRSGRAWVELQGLLDGMLQPLADVLAADVPTGANEHVLDVGCGAGASTRAAARRLNAEGRCTGVDISGALIEAARVQTLSEGATLDYIEADAETHTFPPAAFDRVISRFGVMFFADPVRAFANLRAAAKPGARMHLITWRSPADNPFMTTAERAAARYLPDMPKREPNAPGQFGLADADFTRGILNESGWRAIAIDAFDAPCTLPTSELERYFTRAGPLAAMLDDMDDARRADIIATVHNAFMPYVEGDTVRFTSAVWQVRARA
jgi:SAM-dependent methyltransferase